ncbi:hypothetical protein HK102_006794 [Quaeritorhiza haematococci]|nr:hypothetical protein HK102_006794 [Quaeritorhiza haematococci]
MSSRREIGPSLPPGFGARNASGSSDEDERHKQGAGIGPVLPSGFGSNNKPKNGKSVSDDDCIGHAPSIGPSLPPGFNRPSSLDDDAENGSTGVDIGPALPPGFRKSDTHAPGPSRPSPPTPAKKRDRVGPQLPPHLRYRITEDEDEGEFGPILPAQQQNGDNDEEEEWRRKLAEIDARARGETRSDDDDESSSGEKKAKLERGEWMLLPPEIKKGVQPGMEMKSRTFSKRTIDPNVDRSAWTDTPDEKAKKKGGAGPDGKKRKEPDTPRIQSKDEQLVADYISKYNEKHRGKSLLDEHVTEYVATKKYEQDDPSKRRFDRDMDVVGSRRMDANARKNLLEQAKKLDTRFSHGGRTFL